MSKRQLFSVIIAIFLTLSVMSAGQAQESAPTISGSLQNGTEGGEVPEDLPVTLFVYSDESLAGTYETTSDSSGRFIFEQVELMGDDVLVAFTNYLNVTYTSPSFTYDPDGESPDVPIVIYETTDDPSGVAISQMTLMLSTTDGQLRVGEYYMVSNLGDRTWVGSYDEALGVNRTVEFSLPAEAESLWFSGGGLGERFFSMDNGIVDSAPIVPGSPSAEIFFSYAVPYSGSYEMTKTLNLPVDSIEYLIAQEGEIAIEGDQIVYNEMIETDTESAISYLSPGFGPGQTLSFRIYDQSAFSFGASIGLEIGIGLTVLVFAVFCIFWLVRRNRSGTLPDSAEPLLVEIAQLDNAYFAGNLKKAQYQKRRNRLIERIKQMMS